MSEEDRSGRMEGIKAKSDELLERAQAKSDELLERAQPAMDKGARLNDRIEDVLQRRKSGEDQSREEDQEDQEDQSGEEDQEGKE